MRAVDEGVDRCCRPRMLASGCGRARDFRWSTRSDDEYFDGRVVILGASQRYGGVGCCGLSRKSIATKVRGAAEGIYVTEAETASRCT
jgi:hypothetical protein